MPRKIGILALGAANGKSVACALERAGAQALFIDRPAELRTIDALVMPGVANFGFIADALDRFGLRDPLCAALDDGLPTLGICAGYQILFEASEEAPGVRGLGILRGILHRVRGPKSPHIGWNMVESCDDSKIVHSGWAYFAHAYAPRYDANGAVAQTRYGSETFASASETSGITGVQFHPERSGAYGAALLAQFVKSLRCPSVG